MTFDSRHSYAASRMQNLTRDMYFQDVKNFCTDNVRTALIVGVLGAIWFLMKKPRGIPAGPGLTLPIVGDLPRIVFYSDPRVPIRKLRKKYGDVFSLYFGQTLAVYISGYETIRDALVKHADAFSSRPVFTVNDILFNHKGIAFSSGAVWKDQRKFAVETLREFGVGKTIMEDKIAEEIREYVSVIDNQKGQPFSPCSLTQAAISNIMASLIYGQRFDYENENLKQFLQLSSENFRCSVKTNVLNFIPIFRYLPGDLFHCEKIKSNTRKIEELIIYPSIREHEENFDENDTRDYISSYLKEIHTLEKTKKLSNIKKENLPKSISDLFLTGTETTSTTILWTILYFLHHPDIQARCYKEVQDVVGSGRLPSLRDRESMPYTQAAILESLRLSNITGSGVPRCTTDDVEFKGYLIPKGTVIIPNIDSVFSDKSIWGDDPEVYRPERFLDDDGQVVKKEEFIPFSVGRRVCLGESLAKMELFLFLTTMLQKFELKPVDPNNLPTLTGNFGLTHSPKQYQILAVPR